MKLISILSLFYHMYSENSRGCIIVGEICRFLSHLSQWDDYNITAVLLCELLIINNVVLHGSSVLCLSCAGKRNRDPRIHSLCMCKVPLATCTQNIVGCKHLCTGEISSEGEMFSVGPYKWGF